MHELTQVISYVKTYHFGWISDPSHGWLQVGWNVIDEMKSMEAGIVDEIPDISSFSYHDSNYMYLEEDRDAPLFLKLLDSKGIGYTFTEFPTNEDSFVRNLERF